MATHTTFNARSDIKFAENQQSFMHAINASEKNLYLLDGHDKGPIKYLYLNQPGPLKKFFYVQKDDNEIIGAYGFYIDDFSGNAKTLGISVNKDHREHGIGRALTYHLLDFANKNSPMLCIGKIEHFGKKHMLSMIKELHKDFPNLLIQYNPLQKPVNGYQTYNLDCAGNGREYAKISLG